MKNNFSFCAAALLFVSVQLVAVSAQAQPGSLDGQLRWQSFSAAAYNPLGLVELVQVSYRKPLYLSQNPLFATNYAEAAVVGAATPAYGFVGLQAELQPLSILRLRARAEAIGFFGNFGHVARFNDVNADYSDTALDAIKEAGENSATTGTRWTLTALLQAAVGQVAVRSHLQGTYVNLDLGDGETLYYSPQFDYLIEDGGLFFQNDLDVVWLFESGLVAGARMNSSWAVYSSEIADEDPNGPAHRVGPLVAWPFFEGSGRVKRATAIGLANWYVKHRWRAGEDTPAWLPYIAVGVQIEGDL
ncbi:MAG: hypothetical protein R3E66_18525 [bacterium]